MKVTRGAQIIITDYTYDDLNRLSSVTDDNGVTSYGYDDVGNRTSVTHPNLTSQIYTYDTINRLTSLDTYDSTGALVRSYDYTLHATGRRTQIDELDGRSTAYTYDDLYRLKTEAVTDLINGNYNASYIYDKVGNRTDSTIDGVSTTYAYDDNDRITSQGGTSYTYDDNGNTLTESIDSDVTTYTYDAKNKLTGVEKIVAGVTTNSSYTYNSDGIRTSQAVEGVETKYVVDSNRDYAQVLFELDSLDAVQVQYTYGDDLISQDRLGSVSYYHYDGLGSTRALSNGAGTIADEYYFDAFGEILGQTGSTENDYLFTGEQYDEFLDMQYLRARYYDQGIGRFSSMDTFGGWDNDPITLNKFLYSNSDPVSFIDPTGNIGFGVLAPSGINIQLQNTSIAAGLSSFARLTVGLFAAGVVISSELNNSFNTMLATSAAAQKMLELEREKLESKVTTSSKGRGNLVYHYTDRVAARAIMAMQCGFSSKGFNHPDGLYRPPGIYATLLHPWVSGWTQKDLRSVLYAKPRKQDVSSFVAMESTGFVHLGVESYKLGPRGSCIPVTAVYTGSNLMMPK